MSQPCKSTVFQENLKKKTEKNKTKTNVIWDHNPGKPNQTEQKLESESHIISPHC